MSFAKDFKYQIFNINEQSFEESSLLVFDFQYHQCSIYQEYCDYLGKNPKNVEKLADIPFLPIELFKNHAIKSGSWKETAIFKSSGTTSSGRSMHYVKDEQFYLDLTVKAFETLFGSLSEYQIIALLPSYQEQGHSSLIRMVDHFMDLSDSSSGYFLERDISDVLTTPNKKLVIGVSYALLNVIEKQAISSMHATIMETGGMKGRRKEITRHELHYKLKEGYHVDVVWSEYGMTELFSQAYGESGRFAFPPWASCLVRDINDPFSYKGENQSGGLNIIDLGNIDTCAFIETKDLGKRVGNYFEVLGRFDNSDVRGCNLMV